MIEDALKNARAMHRLAAVVAATYLVFALSVPNQPDVRLWKRDIDALSELRIGDYSGFASAPLLHKVRSDATSLAAAIDACIDGYASRLHVGSEAPGVEQVVHLLRFRPEDTHFGTLEVATLAQLALVIAYPDAARDALAFTPDAEPLLTQLRKFIDDAAPALSLASNEPRPRLTKWRLGEFVGLEEARAGPGAVPLSLDAELPGRPVPIFAEQVAGRWIEAPGTSFVAWLKTRLPVDHFLLTANGRQEALREVLPLTVPAARNHFAALERRRAAGDTSIEVGGVTIPGPVAIVGVPLLLLIVIAHLASAVEHLLTRRDAESAQIAAFSWTALRRGAHGLWLHLLLSGPLSIALFAIAIRVADARPWSCAAAGIVGLTAIAATQRVARRLQLLSTPAPAAAVVGPSNVMPASPIQARFVWSRDSTVYHIAGCSDALSISTARRAQGDQPPHGKRKHTGCPT